MTDNDDDDVLANTPHCFGSLDELYSWADGKLPPHLVDQKLLLASADQEFVRPNESEVEDGKRKPKLVVCHDFQGGYNDHEDARGYTFEHWHLADTFIYFAHSRISPPPPAWTVAAKRHGTKILGTVIFEWKEAAPDLAYLLRGPSHGYLGISGSPTFSPYFADALIELALRLGFAGWLVNVELPLSCGLACSGEPLPPWVGMKAKEKEMRRNALRLRGWVAYLRNQGRRRFRDAGKDPDEREVCWYDSVTLDGQLEWQDALTIKNRMFYEVADSIFTNYTWARPAPKQEQEIPGAYRLDQSPELTNAIQALRCSSSMADEMKRPRSSVYVGIDVFGRNCYGGLESWRSLEMIGSHHHHHTRRKSVVEEEKPSQERISSSSSSVGPSHLTQESIETLKAASGMSVALFAPGWSWEHNEPRELRSSPPSAPTSSSQGSDASPPRSWQEWWDVDLRLWEGPGTSEQRPIRDYFQPRPPPLPLTFEPRFRNLESSVEPSGVVGDDQAWANIFLTSFTLGSGTKWFIEGQQTSKPSFMYAMDPQDLPPRKEYHLTGWTDPSVTAPKPDLIWPLPAPQSMSNDAAPCEVICALNEDDAWNGQVSLQIRLRHRRPSTTSAGLPDSSGPNAGRTWASFFLPICTIRLPPLKEKSSLHLRAHARIKSSSIDVANLAVGIRTPASSSLPLGAEEGEPIQRGWQKVTMRLRLDNDSAGPLVSQGAELGIEFDSAMEGEILVGELALFAESGL